MAKKKESPGAALVRMRWSKATKEDRLRVGAQLARARKRAKNKKKH